MRPNGRTIHKRLMRGRWALETRAIVVRLPLEVVPVPRPSLDYCKDWGTQTGIGRWGKILPDGVEFRSIEPVFGWDPTGRYPEETIHRVTRVADGLYSWWEGSLTRGNGYRGLPPEAVDAHIAVREWHAQYLDGTEPADRGPVLQAFLDADAGWNRSADLCEGGVFILYRTTKQRSWLLASALKRAFRIATKHGINAKLLRGCHDLG